MAVIEPVNITLKNDRQVCIRSACRDDAPTVIAYLKQVFRDDRYFMTTQAEAEQWQTPDKQESAIDEISKDPNKLKLVTSCDGQIISMSDIWVGERLRNRHVGQMGISILPDFRRLRLGTAIMQTMIGWATLHPVIEKLALGVWSRNTPAIALYQKMGFIEEGRKVREVKYADGTYDDCVLMYKMV